MNFLENH